MVSILLFFAYGIQLIEWPENSSFSILSLPIYSSRKIKQQYRILGLIPISGVFTTESHGSILKDIDPHVVLPVAKAAISSLPFGGLISHK